MNKILVISTHYNNMVSQHSEFKIEREKPEIYCPNKKRLQSNTIATSPESCSYCYNSSTYLAQEVDHERLAIIN